MTIKIRYNRAGGCPLAEQPPLTPPCVPFGTRRFNHKECRDSRCNDCDCDRADKAGSWRWWLRARGNFSELTAAVASNGIVGSFGLYTGDYGVVRPAMWISLDP